MDEWGDLTPGLGHIESFDALIQHDLKCLGRQVLT